MKCRAVEVLQDERTEQVTKMYGKKALEAMQSEAALLLLDGCPLVPAGGAENLFRRPGGELLEGTERQRHGPDL